MPKILLVDDDVGIQETLQLFLENEGYTVALASNGKMALELLRSEPLPELILLDLMMPVMNGWEFLEIRSHDERLLRVPVILMTASAVTEAMKAANDVLSKPFRLERIANSIRANLAGSGI